MKLFKNKVGRPSNATIRKRRIVVFLVLALVAVLIGSGVYFITMHVKVENKDTYLKRISAEKLTATFVTKELNYVSSTRKSCISYNGRGCTITLPYFNRKGHFNMAWSLDSRASSNLKGVAWSSNFYYLAGSKYTLTKNTTFYPNFNHVHYDIGYRQNIIYYQYRNISVQKTARIGNVIIDFQKGFNTNNQVLFMQAMNIRVNRYPWLFVPAKVFFFTGTGYDKHSFGGGLSQHNDIWGTGSTYSNIDLRSDIARGDENKTVYNSVYHEFAHALDAYYKYKTGGNKEISETASFDEFYNSLRYKTDISKKEFFAAMVANYIFHIKERKTSYEYYGLKKGQTLTTEELKRFEKLLDRYLKQMGMRGSIINGKGSSVK